MDVIKYNDFGYVLHHGRPFGKGYTIGMAIFNLADPVTDERDPDYEFGYRHVRGVDLFWDFIPSEKQITAKAQEMLSRLSIAEITKVVEPERVYSEDDVKQMLVDKGLIAESETVADLKSIAELTAVAEVVEVVK